MSVEPYGTAIHDAISRGDAGSLQKLLSRARDLNEKQGDLAKAIRDGERALAKLERSTGK
jgi:hypothetical protein